MHGCTMIANKRMNYEQGRSAPDGVERFLLSKSSKKDEQLLKKDYLSFNQRLTVTEQDRLC